MPPDSSVTRAWCGHKEVGLGLQHSELAFVAQKQGEICVWGSRLAASPSASLGLQLLSSCTLQGANFIFQEAKERGAILSLGACSLGPEA